MSDRMWQIFRTISEFVEGFETLDGLDRAITVFGSARVPDGDPAYKQATDAGRLIAEAGYATITGGGPGIMEAANRGAIEAGGKSVGLNIILPHEQGPNEFQNISVDFRYFYARKVCFLKHCNGVICFPGGFGTLDEFFELVTLIQTGKNPKIPIALVGSAYWDRLIDFVRDTLLGGGFVSEPDMGLFSVFDDIGDAVEFVCD